MNASGPGIRHGESTHARVFVNDRPIDVRSESTTVAEVVRKAGFDPDRTDCFRLRDAKDKTGSPISMDEELDLRKSAEAIYLRCVRKDAKRQEDAPSILPTLTTTPDDDPRRGLTTKDINAPVPPPPADPSGGPEPPGPPPL